MKEIILKLLEIGDQITTQQILLIICTACTYGMYRVTKNYIKYCGDCHESRAKIIVTLAKMQNQTPEEAKKSMDDIYENYIKEHPHSLL